MKSHTLNQKTFWGGLSLAKGGPVVSKGGVYLTLAASLSYYYVLLSIAKARKTLLQAKVCHLAWFSPFQTGLLSSRTL